jgi:hypothetical protein
VKTPNIELPELSQVESPAYVNMNDGFRALDAVVQLSVLSQALATPPTVEQGARYIVAAGPTGAWAGHAKHIAYKTAAGWDFRTPRKGWIAVLTEDSTPDYQVTVYFDGIDWVLGKPALSISELIDVQIITAPNDGDALVWDVGLGAWVPGSAPPISIDELTDVDTSSTPPTDGQVLLWDNGGSLWIPGDMTGGGGGSGGGNTTPDSHPVTPDNADDEFETGSSIDLTGARFTGATAWAWRNQSTATGNLSQGSLVFAGPGHTGSNLHILEQPTSGSTWKYRCKISGFFVNPVSFSGGGMCVVNNSNGKVIGFYKLYSSGFAIAGDKWTNVTTYSASLATNAVWDNTTGRWGRSGVFLEIELVGTNLVFRYSDSGYEGTFVAFATEALATFITTADRIGLIVHNDTGSNAPTVTFDWFRKMS